MSGGRPSPGKLGLEADTRSEPGPGVGTLLGPREDATHPPRGQGALDLHLVLHWAPQPIHGSEAIGRCV